MTAEIERLTRSADAACGLMKALANRDRLTLLCQMSRGEYCVGELAAMTGIRQPTLSQQLTVVRELGLASARRQGKEIYYSLASKEAMAVLQVLYEQFCSDASPAKGGGR